MDPFTVYVCGFAFSKDGDNVLLIHKKTGPEVVLDCWNGLGGKTQEGDVTEEEAMSREFKEEADIYVPPHKWEHITTLRFENSEVWFFYTHTDDIFEANGRSIEEGNMTVHQTDELPHSVVYNLRWLIPLALDDSVIKPLGLQAL